MTRNKFLFSLLVVSIMVLPILLWTSKDEDYYNKAMQEYSTINNVMNVDINHTDRTVIMELDNNSIAKYNATNITDKFKNDYRFTGYTLIFTTKSKGMN